jgi:hypothetical protein
MEHTGSMTKFVYPRLASGKNLTNGAARRKASASFLKQKKQKFF